MKTISQTSRGDRPRHEHPAKHPASKRVADLDQTELEARVCNLFCEGKTASEIVEQLKRGKPGVHLKRQDPYHIVRNAGKMSRLQYLPPIDLELSHRARKTYGWLHAVDVVHSILLNDVAYHAAVNLLEMICGARESNNPKDDFHIGFAGGGLLQQTARLLADMLRRTTRPLPKRLFFHAMVARYSDDPRYDPNFFVGYFTSDPPLPIETRFVGLLAPGIISTDSAAQFRRMEGIREAYERIEEIDVIVTSAGGHWKAGCSALYKLYKEQGESATLSAIEKQNCIGDLMWRPLGTAGPIELEFGNRAMTLVELSELPALIRKGKWVMLVMGPCATCRQPKTEVLQTVLGLGKHLITDLVVDSRTARACFL